MSTRHIYFLIFALLSVSNLGCCGYLRGYGGQTYGSSCASCGVSEDCASCGLPEASCGCEDVCCEATCGINDCYEASCGVDDVCTDVGCGSSVAPCPIIGQCWFLQRLRRAFSGNYGCYGGCSSEGYVSEWQNDPPCSNCQARSTGGHYGGAYGRRAYLAKQHQNISEELRFADEGSGPTFR